MWKSFTEITTAKYRHEKKSTVGHGDSNGIRKKFKLFIWAFKCTSPAKSRRAKGDLVAYGKEERLAFWVRQNHIQHRGLSKVSSGHLPKDDTFPSPGSIEQVSDDGDFPSLWLVYTCVFTLSSDYIRSHLEACHLREPMTPPTNHFYICERNLIYDSKESP